jgi:hypothetical protein
VDIDTAKFAASYLDAASTPGFLTLTKADQLAFAEDILRQRFIKTYLGESGAYQAQWQAFMQAQDGLVTANLSDPALLDRFRYQVLWAELSASGKHGSAVTVDAKINPGKYSAADLSVEKLYAQGFTAIELAGLGAPFSFNSSARMLFSQIRSQSGGNVDVLVPGGSLDVGPTQLADISPSKQGLVANQGDSRVFVRDSINVNTSRWFAIDGGNLLGWASTGDIDAGKGSRTAVSGSSQRLSVDRRTGRISLIDGGASTGSGIATIFNRPLTEGGNVELYAVRGAVDAGEAGIRAIGDLLTGGEIRNGIFMTAVGSGTPAVAPPAVPAISMSTVPTEKTTISDQPGAGLKPDAVKNSVLTVEVSANTDPNTLAPTGAGSTQPDTATDSNAGDNKRKRQ